MKIKNPGGGAVGAVPPRLRKKAGGAAWYSVKKMGRRTDSGLTRVGREGPDLYKKETDPAARSGSVSSQAADEVSKRQRQVYTYASRKAGQKALSAAWWVGKKTVGTVFRVGYRLGTAVIRTVIGAGKGLITVTGPAGAALLFLVVIIAVVHVLNPFPFKREGAHEAVIEVNKRAQIRLLSVLDTEDYSKLLIKGQRASWLNMLADFGNSNYLYKDNLEVDGFFYEPDDVVDELDRIYLIWHLTADSLLEKDKYTQQEEKGFSWNVKEVQAEEGAYRQLDLTVEPYSVELYREREAEERWNTDKMRWDKDLFDLYQSEEYQEVFREMLYGTATPNIADVAKVQFGAPGGEKYWKDYFGQPGRWEWCAIFVSYCIHNSVLHESVDVNHGSVMQWYDYFLQHKRFVTVSEENNPLPQPGWIIFYNWWKEDENGNMVQDQKLDHVAVVTEVNSTAGKIEIVTVEGNVSDSCLMLVKDFHKLYEIGVVGYGFFDIPEVLDEPAA